VLLVFCCEVVREPAEAEVRLRLGPAQQSCSRCSSSVGVESLHVQCKFSCNSHNHDCDVQNRQ
jgi:Zn finger protein HypA/HybF involved in hydrogenase expression